MFSEVLKDGDGFAALFGRIDGFWLPGFFLFGFVMVGNGVTVSFHGNSLFA